MKKAVAILVVALGLTSTLQAQREKKGDDEKFSVEQKTELAVKKMTLKLDLTPSQAKQIKPLIAEKIADRKAMHEKRKALKESGKKPTADERYKMKNEKLDKQIAFKNKMKNILNEKQFEKFEKMSKHKMRRAKKWRKGKRNDRDHEDEDRG